MARTLTRPDQARPGQARPDQARPGQARPGQARPGQGQARPGQARQGKTRQDKTRQDRQTQNAHVHDVTTHAAAERCTLTSRSTQHFQLVSGTIWQFWFNYWGAIQLVCEFENSNSYVMRCRLRSKISGGIVSSCSLPKWQPLIHQNLSLVGWWAQLSSLYVKLLPARGAAADSFYPGLQKTCT